MATLRSRLIRLAHTEPSLRPHLLPILTASLGGTVTIHELKTPRLGVLIDVEIEYDEESRPSLDYPGEYDIKMVSWGTGELADENYDPVRKFLQESGLTRHDLDKVFEDALGDARVDYYDE